MHVFITSSYVFWELNNSSNDTILYTLYSAININVILSTNIAPSLKAIWDPSDIANRNK